MLWDLDGSKAPACTFVLVALIGCGPRHEGGGVDEAGAGGAPVGAGGTTVGAGANTGGAGGAAARGYDRVIGCPAVAWPEVATFTRLGDMDQRRFSPYVLSGDGRVVAGRLGPTYKVLDPFRWRADVGFTPMRGVAGSPEALSCTGEVAIIRGNTGGTFRETELTGATYLFGDEHEDSVTLHLSPDGSVLISNLNRIVDPGPYPVRWTPSAGLERLDALRNSLVYHTGPDGRTLLGIDTLHIYRWQEGVGKTLLLFQVPVGASPPVMPVSADGSTIAFSSTTTYDSITVSRLPERYGDLCPDAPCQAHDISGTGKVVLVNTNGESLVWTLAHGFRNLTQLVQQYGGDTQGLTLSATQISDDGQAFTGFAVVPGDFGPDYVAFYATLPAAAYD